MTHLLANRYQTGDLLGSGVMADVYRAADTQTGQTVAVKVLKPNLVARNPDMLERFRREGEALRNLNHPNITTLLDVVEEQDAHILVMEYVPGGDLAGLIARHPGGLPLDLALSIALELADALTRAHHLGIIHRDIKPANILIAGDGTPRLSDFGMAHVAQHDRVTAEGMIVGTFAYLSPQGWMGHEATPAGDIWSYGVVLFEMLTGHLPFDDSSPAVLMNSILNAPLPDIASLRPDLPDAVVDLLYRMLTRNREERIPSVRLVGAEIERLLKGIDYTSAGVSAASEEGKASVFEAPRPDSFVVGHNLPAQTTEFVGRTEELERLETLLVQDNKRLVTILGPGGMGKSRLALEAAERNIKHFSHGVFFVDLAPLKPFDTQLVSSLKHIAQNLRRGYSIAQSFEMVAEFAPEPTAAEFSRFVAQMHEGVPFLEAVSRLQARLNSSYFDRFVDLVQQQVQDGGNFANKVDELIQWLQAESRSEAWQDMRLAHDVRELIALHGAGRTHRELLEWMTANAPEPYNGESEAGILLLDEGKEAREAFAEVGRRIASAHFDRFVSALFGFPEPDALHRELDLLDRQIAVEIKLNITQNPVEDAIVVAAASAVGYQFQSEMRSQKQQLLDFLANKQMLLILDNFEHLLRGAELVTEIITAAPDVQMLVTSRMRLYQSSEAVFVLNPMDFPDWERPDDALEYSAVQLFMQSARRGRLDFELTEDNLDHIARICKLVGGIPLGILLAAAWVDTLSLAEIAEEIGESLDFLESEMTDLPERQRSMRAAIDYSWRLLSEEERAAFSRMSVFRGGCTRQAAQAVSGTSVRMLTALMNKSFLRRNQESGRFSIHELLRQYAEEYLEASGDAVAIRDAHMEYYLTALAEREEDLKGQDQLNALDDIESDFENVRAAWLWAVERENLAGMRGAVRALGIYCEIRSRVPAGEELLDAARDRLAGMKGDKAENLWGWVVVQREMMSMPGRQLADRATSSEAALDIAQRTEDTLLRICALYVTGWMQQSVQERPEALARFKESAALFEAAGEPYYQALVLHYLWLVYRTSGDFETALPYLQQAVAIRRKIGDRDGLARSLTNLGGDAGWGTGEGNWALAESYYKEAIGLFESTGNRAGAAYARNSLAGLYLVNNRIEDAWRLAQEALATARQVNHARTIAMCLDTLADLALLDEDYERVEKIAEEMLALHIADLEETAIRALLTLVFAAIGRGDFDLAGVRLNDLVRTVAANTLGERLLYLRAFFHAHDGQYERAAELLGPFYRLPWAKPIDEALFPFEQQLVRRLKSELGEEAFRAAMARGEAMDVQVKLHEEYGELVDRAPG